MRTAFCLVAISQVILTSAQLGFAHGHENKRHRDHHRHLLEEEHTNCWPGSADGCIPPQDVYFMDKNGNMQRGVRCATPFDGPPRRQLPKQEDPLLELQHLEEKNGGWRRLDTVINVPVVFHVTYKDSGIGGPHEGNIPQRWIDDQIEVLNDVYADAKFSFTLHDTQRHPSNKYYNGCFGSEREMKDEYAVDPAHNLNIYTCSPGGGILGWSYLPWYFPEDDPRHGVVLLDESLPGGSAFPYNEGDTATHEVGHYLGLWHTFQNGCDEPGDEVDDTPCEETPAFGCPDGRDTCPDDPGEDPIFNFMDYTDDDCMDHFTLDQGDRMHDQVLLHKPSLIGDQQ